MGRVSIFLDKMYEMSVQGSIYLFGELHCFVKCLELFFESSEVQYDSLTSTIIDRTQSICKKDIIF